MVGKAVISAWTIIVFNFSLCFVLVHKVQSLISSICGVHSLCTGFYTVLFLFNYYLCLTTKFSENPITNIGILSKLYAEAVKNSLPILSLQRKLKMIWKKMSIFGFVFMKICILKILLDSFIMWFWDIFSWYYCSKTFSTYPWQ